MADSKIRKAEPASPEALLADEDRLGSWMRERDRLGALGETEAALEGALARGHALGIEEARSEALEDKRTLLVTMLEAKFGEVDDATMDAIAATDPRYLNRWFLVLLRASSLTEVLERAEALPGARQTA